MRNQGKLNRLMCELPEGLLADAAWMEARGYSRSLRSQYVRAGWLESPTPRIYRRSRQPLSWQQVVASLQGLLDFPVIVGGRTALEQQGYDHYLSLTLDEVHLYGTIPPPAWLAKLPLDIHFQGHNSRRLFPGNPASPLGPGIVSAGEGEGVGLALRYSSKERAILELLDELPEYERFDRIDVLMEGLSDLAPSRLQTLLEACTSVKVKRLFLFFAERHRHAWFSWLDPARLDLGSGKRSLVKGGKLVARYMITVPASLAE